MCVPGVYTVQKQKLCDNVPAQKFERLKSTQRIYMRRARIIALNLLRSVVAL